jgi:phage-related tail protein
MTTEQIQQTQQQAGFMNGYSHFAKVEDAAKGEVRITVSVFAENSDIAVKEAVKSYKQLKGALSDQTNQVTN